MAAHTVLRRVRSLCPQCLRLVDARYVQVKNGTVYLEKHCDEHGDFRIAAWAAPEGAPAFLTWKNAAPARGGGLAATPAAKGCPFDCGLCPAHAQATCCALVETTQRCNMRCPVCYASSGGHAPDPDMRALDAMLDALRAYGGQANVQLSGGEPTVRDDVPAIIRRVHERGFPFVQLNTNGLRLARERGYARELKDAGLDLVYLQWDGLRESTFRALRGGNYLAEKERALDNCLSAGLTVLLVATVARGVNDDELGALLRHALAAGPQARGLHLQPVASFGRCPWKMEDAPRLTLPELMHNLERQSDGLVRARDFRPPTSEHALCSFSAVYQRTESGGLDLVESGQGCCACGSGARAQAAGARDFVAGHWGARAVDAAFSEQPDGLGNFLTASRLRRRFTLSAMAFQDAWSLDVERVRRCHIHVVAPDKRLVPFCMYNLTSNRGVPLYRKQ